MAAKNLSQQVENLSKNLLGHVRAPMRVQTYLATPGADEAYGVLLAISLLQATPNAEVIEVVFNKSYSHTYSKESAYVNPIRKLI